ncbi:hypothetical protein KSP40_PGU020758 [Platanthera guangdongensis]|uniref:Exocyst subunit Exo70 family protein n=1 Tax=Platanthera guangdongensis TaxID=2320717 RepID=A0ABR2LSY0_9ASPA
MAKKTLLKLFCFGRSRSSSLAIPVTGSTSPPDSFSSRLMDENIAFAESIITKWDYDSPECSKSLFSGAGGAESTLFLRSVADLRRAMLFYSSPDCHDLPSSRAETLIRAQTLMQSAMRRLEHEFHRILSSNRHNLDLDSLSSSSSDDEDIRFSSINAIADLRSIAESMIANGYGLECVRIYKLLRKSIVEETLFCLGFDLRLPCSNLYKLDWRVVDLRIRSWLAAARVSFPTLVATERLLCSHVFFNSDSIGLGLDLDLTMSCFADVTLDAALQFLSFPESVAKTKPSPEKLFRILELHRALSDLYLHIESNVTESMEMVKSKALAALKSLAEAARAAIQEFELSIQKESSKFLIPGCRVHPLIRHAMKYLACLADHVPTLSDVYAGIPFRSPQPLPETSAPCPSTLVPATVSERIAWLLLVVFCKLDRKAEFYKEVSLSYLFLANNMQYVVNKVRGSGLSMVLGRSWAERHEETARRYAEKYLGLGWGKVAAIAAEEEDGGMAAFTSSFEEAAVAQEGRAVEDDRMREAMRIEVAGMILPAYRGLYERFMVAHGGGVEAAAAVRYSPASIRDRIEQIFVAADEAEPAGLMNWSMTSS